MVVLRKGPKGAIAVPFGLAALVFVCMPGVTGMQDIADFISQPAAAEAWRDRAMPSPPRTAIKADVFRFPTVLGAAIPTAPEIRLAKLEVRDPETTGSLPKGDRLSFGTPHAPVVDRARKGDRLVPSVIDSHVAPAPLETQPAGDATPPKDGSRLEADAVPSISDARPPRSPPAVRDPVAPAQTEADAETAEPEDAAAVAAVSRLYFQSATLGAEFGKVEPWAAGEAPIVMLPRAPVIAAPKPADGGGQASASVGPSEPKRPGIAREGVTVADKGQVTGDDRRPKTPGELLRLEGKSLAKAEKCLANAVYFEARSEPVRGQIAVAQVVLNRAFSGYYPDDVCGVVYQNAYRHLSCQFTFACDGIPDVVTEQEHWERAKRIAQETLRGKLYLAEVGKSTHYHASYVYPYWVRSMRKLTKIGLHTFYRPRKWGDGAEDPSWGSPVVTAEIVSKL